MIDFGVQHTLFGISASVYGNILAFLTSYLTLIYLAPRFKIERKHIHVIFILILIFGLYLGPQIFYFFGPWGTKYGLLESFVKAINPLSTGRVYIGGLIFTTLAIAFYLKFKGLDFWKYADFLVIGIPIAQFAGRIGCLFNGCCYGIETGVPWAILHDGLMTHPTQIYLALNGLLLFGLMLYLSRKNLEKGTLFILYFMLYSATRFVIEFFRDYGWHYFGLSFTQIACIFLFLFFGILFWKKVCA